MRIALDYDKTFTLNKGFWTKFITDVQEIGGSVSIVTVRHPTLDHNEDFDQLKGWLEVETFFTDGAPKKAFCEDLGVSFDIWIDDNPDAIINGSKWGHDSKELADWRANGRP